MTDVNRRSGQVGFERFERLRTAIDRAVSRQRAPEGDAGCGPLDDELTKLASLRDAGVITAADFETVKAKLLGTR